MGSGYIKSIISGTLAFIDLTRTDLYINCEFKNLFIL